MEFILIICGVMLLLTAVSQIFWEGGFGWVNLIWTVVVEAIKVVLAIIILTIALVVILVTLLTRKKP